MNFDELNAIPIRSSFTEERIKFVQTNIKKVIHTIETQILTNGSSFVKFAFIQDNKDPENMWIEVNEIDINKRTLKGDLDNIPLHLTNIKYKDKVERSFDDIIQVLGE